MAAGLSTGSDTQFITPGNGSELDAAAVLSTRTHAGPAVAEGSVLQERGLGGVPGGIVEGFQGGVLAGVPGGSVGVLREGSGSIMGDEVSAVPRRLEASEAEAAQQRLLVKQLTCPLSKVGFQLHNL